MDDKDIIGLYLSRSEQAVHETENKYSGLLHNLIGNILVAKEDVEECFNDTLLGIWNSIPPTIPENFLSYICRVAKNLSLKKYDYNTSEKRKADFIIALNELEECVSGGESVEDVIDAKETGAIISEFLKKCRSKDRTIFVLRYWYMDSIKQISEKTGYKEGDVKVTLSRTRKFLKQYLNARGVNV